MYNFNNIKSTIWLIKKNILLKTLRNNNINKTINEYILDHKKKYIIFIFDCRIDSVIEKFDKNIKVNLYIMFYSEKEDVTYNYYLRCPKPMIENRLLKFLDTNPLLIKSLGAYLDPYPRIVYIINNYWGRIEIINRRKKLVHDYNWYDSDPNHPSQELLEFMRSC